MDNSLLGSGRLVGVLLSAPFTTTVLFIVYIALTQNWNMFRPTPQELAANPAIAKFGSIMGIVGMIAAFLGFTLLTVHMQEDGQNLTSILGLALFALTAMLWIVDMSLNMSVRIWGAEYFVKHGEESQVWAALSEWNRVVIPTIYLYLGYLSTAAFGLAILQTAVLPLWLGWTAIGWSALWLVIVVLGWGIPAFIGVLPLLLGIVLLVRGYAA